MKTINVLIFLVIFSTIRDAEAKLKTTVFPGAYRTELYFPLLKGKTLGIVANQTSQLGKLHLVDSLKSAGFNIKCVFAPEHGFRGEKGAGEEIESTIDKNTGIPIVSLYGNHHGPDAKDLAGIDIVIFDIQDVGIRFYTYISTLQYVMEACAENNVELIVLDRPNPHSNYVDGPVLEKKYSSFIGMQPVPVMYGMTIGEYAQMLNGEGWLKKKLKCKLTVISVKNYFHSMTYSLPIAPSPNLKDMDAIYLYPSICFFEGTKVSVGRGTEKPFHIIGYPAYPDTGFSFTPTSIEGYAVNPPYRDTLCYGIDLSGEGLKTIKSPGIRLKWLLDMYASYPDKENFFSNFFEKLAGTAELRKQIIELKSEKEIKASWQPGIKKFKVIRKKYLLYLDVEML